jgi:hypothetical protein
MGVKKGDKALPYMAEKAKLGAAASHANQHGSYDESNTARKEAEIESRVEYLDEIPDDFSGISDPASLPPLDRLEKLPQ